MINNVWLAGTSAENFTHYIQKNSVGSNNNIQHVKSGLFRLSSESIPIISKFLRYFDFLFIFGIIVGLMILAFSTVGNSGKYRKSAAGIIVGSFVGLVMFHVAIIGGFAYGNLGDGKLVTFIFILLFQLLIYMMSPIMFEFGSTNLLFHEMTSDDSFYRASKSNFKTMRYTLLAGFIIAILVIFVS